MLPPTASLVTEEGGYRLLVAPEELDATRFGRLLAQARGDHRERALPLLDEALALWRGRCSRSSSTGRSPSPRRDDSKSCTGRHAKIVPPCC